MTVSVEQHKQMVKLGIKQRRDGLFGYKLRCARKSCTEFVDTCFGAETLEEAVYEVTHSRSAYHHDTACWFSDDAAWDGCAEDIRTYIGENCIEDDSVEWRAALTFIKRYPRKDATWLRRLRKAEPEKYAATQKTWATAIGEWGDYEPEDYEVDCEVPE